MLPMVEKGIRGKLYHSIDRYSKVNNKYMKDYDKNKASSYLKYWDVNNLNDWTISQKLSVNRFKWVEDLSEFHEDFIKSFNGKINEGYFLETDYQYPENLHELHNDLPFLLKIKKVEKVKKLVANLRDKEEYIIHIRDFKQTLNQGSVLKKKIK